MKNGIHISWKINRFITLFQYCFYIKAYANLPIIGVIAINSPSNGILIHPVSIPTIRTPTANTIVLADDSEAFWSAFLKSSKTSFFILG